jgi:hypothetical protein
MTIRRALFSVYDKTGLAAFARELSGLGVELLASSGSAKLLADERIPVTPLAATASSRSTRLSTAASSRAATCPRTWRSSARTRSRRSTSSA